MKIACTSDLHGQLPEIPEADLLLLAGDYCPKRRGAAQNVWFMQEFQPWLLSIAQRMPIVGIAGNHDWWFQDNSRKDTQLEGWTYLQDNETAVGGLRIWGAPWQPVFFGWAFNLDDLERSRKWSLIPEGMDIWLLHGPPKGYGDTTDRGDSVGCRFLRDKIQEMQPQLVVCGHIHYGYGRYMLGNTTILNVAHVDEAYKPRNPVVIVETN